MTTINNQDDFLQALRDNPLWREAVRAEILSNELMALPGKFDVFVEKMTAFTEQMTAFTEQQKRFNEEQKQLNQTVAAHLERIDARFQRMENDISTVKAAHVRYEFLKSVAVIALGLKLEYVKTLTQTELVKMYNAAGGDLEPGEVMSFCQADAIIEATDGKDTVYVAAEISYTADQRDSSRSMRNARLLKQYTGRKAIPAVASFRNDYYVAELVESGALHWFPLEHSYFEVD